MERTQLYEHFKRLKNYTEWETFEKHILERIQQHKEVSVEYLAKDKVIDAQRQAWICEGLLEAIEEVKSVIDFEESLAKQSLNKLKNLGQKLSRY